uniref:PCNA-associated factor n=1 Tax=Cuerna arida TaxID=1464854 RepID=A0A1B6G4T3_9HEMI
MVRTKDSASVKVVGAKAPRKISSTTTSTAVSSGSDSKKKHSGGNSYCPRETPAWQKPITQFFGTSDKPCTSTSCDKEQTTDEAENSKTCNENHIKKEESNSHDMEAANCSTSGEVQGADKNEGEDKKKENCMDT